MFCFTSWQLSKQGLSLALSLSLLSFSLSLPSFLHYLVLKIHIALSEHVIKKTPRIYSSCLQKNKFQMVQTDLDVKTSK